MFEKAVFKQFDDYLKVSIIRDERDRFRSLYSLAPKGIKPTDDFFYTREQWLFEDGKLLADVLIPFEGLPGSALRFLQRIGVPITEFPHWNKRD